MKNLVWYLLATVAMMMAAPGARAFDKDPWHDPTKKLEELDVRMNAVYAKQNRYGASPRMQHQIVHLHDGMVELTARVRDHAGDPKVALSEGNDLADLLTRVEDEYRDRLRGGPGVVIQVTPH